MIDATQLRIIIAILGALLLLAIWLFGRPKKPTQGTRTGGRRAAGDTRVEPTLGDAAADAGLDADTRRALDDIGAEIAGQRDPIAQELPLEPYSGVGVRPQSRIERIVTLHVSARDGETIAGPELVVAAEKIGLQFGDMGIYHRLVENRADAGPVFSVANMVKPGKFDPGAINQLRTPGLTFFMTLPGPLPALDAWDMMLPAAQRFAELIDAQVLDAEHNALGRQTIQHVRDELRAYDRKQEKQVIKRSW